MAKESKDKLQNLLKFSEYEHLQGKQKATKKTEIGGFAVLEHHLEGDAAGQLEFIKENIEKCGKKKITKIYHMVENSVIKKQKKEKKEKDDKKEGGEKSE